MSSWEAWANNLASLRRGYFRPAGVYGMVTDDELHMLEMYARFSYTGAGQIADLGCWLGATTGALARGVQDNPQAERQRPIDAYDQFHWQAWMTPIARSLGVAREYREGDDFLPDTRAALAAWEPLIRFHKVDLAVERTVREPVEFLLIDAMKSWPLANAITRSFFPKLIAGRSLVVQQDFGYHHAATATNYLVMWALREWMVPVLQVPNSTMVAFFVTRPLSKRDVPRFDPESIPIEDIEAAWRYCLGFAGPHIAPAIRFAKLLFLLEQDRLPEAVRAAQEFAASGTPIGAAARYDMAVALGAGIAGAGRSRAERAQISQIGQILGIDPAG
jgi:hypothetical protein